MTKTATMGHTCDTGEELPGKILDLVGRKWAERVVLEPVVYRLSQQIKHHADVIPVIEAVVQVEAFAINLRQISMREYARVHSISVITTLKREANKTTY